MTAKEEKTLQDIQRQGRILALICSLNDEQLSLATEHIKAILAEREEK